MKKAHSIVIVDDFKEWTDVHERLIHELPEAQQFEIAAFTSDKEAAKYVQKNPSAIQGYVQDLRRQTHIDDGKSIDGIRFFNEIIEPYTPWAWVIIVSASIEINLVREVLKYGQIFNFMSKADFDGNAFKFAISSAISSSDLRIPEEKTRPITEERKDLINAVSFPWQELCRYLASHPEYLHKLDPKRFEELIAEMYSSYGWQVELTASTRDGGYDIIAVRKSTPTDIRVLIEAKRFAPNRPVGVQLVRSLYGIRLKNPASQVVLATSSYVSRDAKTEFCHVIPWELDFIERDKILSWCHRHGGVLIGGTMDIDHFS